MFAVAGGMQKMSQDPGLDGRNIFRKLCVSVGSYTPCQRIWCGACYTFNPKLKFHIHKVETKTGENPGADGNQLVNAWHEEDQESNPVCSASRDGDHLMASIENDVCLSKATWAAFIKTSYVRGFALE
jgi:hypothetical protein